MPVSWQSFMISSAVRSDRMGALGHRLASPAAAERFVLVAEPPGSADCEHRCTEHDGAGRQDPHRLLSRAGKTRRAPLGEIMTFRDPLTKPQSYPTVLVGNAQPSGRGRG